MIKMVLAKSATTVMAALITASAGSGIRSRISAGNRLFGVSLMWASAGSYGMGIV